MAPRELPYIARCNFCEQGLLRFTRCPSCRAVVAMCDECELIWTDIAAVHADPTGPARGAHPTCPLCRDSSTRWTRLDREEVERAELSECVAGFSS